MNTMIKNFVFVLLLAMVGVQSAFALRCEGIGLKYMRLCKAILPPLQKGLLGGMKLMQPHCVILIVHQIFRLLMEIAGGLRHAL